MKLTVVYYFSFLFFLLSVFVSGVVDSQDGFQYLAVARNIYYKGKPSSPPYEYDTRKNIHMPSMIGNDGDSYAFTGLGFSVALVPAVAIADVVYKYYNIAPPVHFPLESDWLILLLASFTNAFFGALLGTTLFLYFVKLKVPKKQAILLSMISILATNLFVYTKHILAHMMFITFLTLSFYLLKEHFDSQNKKSFLVKNRYLFFSAICFGVVVITYNSTYLLAIPPYILYFLLLSRPKLNIDYLRRSIGQALVFLVGFLPLYFIHLWFEKLRTFDYSSSLASAEFLGSYAQNRLLQVPIPILFEGIYGQLFSSGRSIFLYSLPLLLLVIFWFKIKPRIKPELIVFLSISAIYILFYGAQYSLGQPDQGIKSMWTGESSWGPRYLTPIIPFGMLIVGNVYTQLKRAQKLLIFLPLVVVGLYIQLLGVLVPYQIKYHNLDKKFLVNRTEFTMYDYINVIPRYSPIVTMSKKLVKLKNSFPLSWDRGPYNVRFIDGIDFPFNVGGERWRVIEGDGYVHFDNNTSSPVKTIYLGLINHIVGESDSPVKLEYRLNNKPLPESQTIFEPQERRVISLSIPDSFLVDKDNLLEINIIYDDPEVMEIKSQILGLISMSINDSNVNLESIDIPYVSKLGPAMSGLTYRNYGGTNQDKWKQWELHTQMFERLPDFWWVRNLFYWDIPKKFIITPFAISIAGLVFSYSKLRKKLR